MCNRPRAGHIDDAAREKDIAAWAARQKSIAAQTRGQTNTAGGAKPGLKGSNDFGYTQRSEPCAWKDNVIVARNFVHQSRKSALLGEQWASDEVPGPKYVFSPEHQHRTAPFSRADRFKRCECLKSCPYILQESA